jgi:hypothetical protein
LHIETSGIRGLTRGLAVSAPLIASHGDNNHVKRREVAQEALLCSILRGQELNGQIGILGGQEMLGGKIQEYPFVGLEPMFNETLKVFVGNEQVLPTLIHKQCAPLQPHELEWQYRIAICILPCL